MYDLYPCYAPKQLAFTGLVSCLLLGRSTSKMNAKTKPRTDKELAAMVQHINSSLTR